MLASNEELSKRRDILARLSGFSDEILLTIPEPYIFTIQQIVLKTERQHDPARLAALANDPRL